MPVALCSWVKWADVRVKNPVEGHFFLVLVLLAPASVPLENKAVLCNEGSAVLSKKDSNDVGEALTKFPLAPTDGNAVIEALAASSVPSADDFPGAVAVWTQS